MTSCGSWPIDNCLLLQEVPAWTRRSHVMCWKLSNRSAEERFFPNALPKVSKLEDVSHEMLVLLRPRVSSRVSGFLDTSPCLWGKLQNLLFEGFQAGCHVVLRGRHGTLWHSNLFANVPKVSKLDAVAHEMLALLRPRVSSRVSGFLDASPCLWGSCKTSPFQRFPSSLVVQSSILGIALCKLCTLQSSTGNDFVQAL